VEGQNCLRLRWQSRLGRDGTHVELVTVPVSALNPLPKNLTFEQAAAMGVAYMTAWATFEEAGDILRKLTPGIEDGTFHPPVTRTVSFSGIVEAYRLVGDGKTKEKLILVP
jgi:NADPH:quinone reductase-like Zn-dependent oxidoreductase